MTYKTLDQNSKTWGRLSAILLLTWWARDILHSCRHAHELSLTSNMADAGAEEHEMAHQKMSEPTQPANNHNAQTQKNESSKKSLKKKGE